MARQVISGLELTLSPSEAERLKPDQPINPVAYEYYLRGIDLYSKSDFPMAIQMLEKSTELAPKYALTWANLGRSYAANASFQFGGGEQYRKAQAALERALALQPLQPDQIDARIYMANMFTDTSRAEKAVPLLRDALRANSNQAETHWELGYAYRFAGMLQQSVSECERARQLDPGVKLTSSALNISTLVSTTGFSKAYPKPTMSPSLFSIGVLANTIRSSGSRQLGILTVPLSLIPRFSMLRSEEPLALAFAIMHPKPWPSFAGWNRKSINVVWAIPKRRTRLHKPTPRWATRRQLYEYSNTASRADFSPILTS